MKKTTSVIIIEDEEIWVQSLSILLQDLDYSVAGIARTTDEALTAISSTDYDIALLDIHLNGRTSGLELGKILSGMYHKPYIFVTSSTGHSRQEAAEAKPSAYLTKPVDESSLFIAIQNALNNFTDNRIADPETKNEAPSCFFVKHGNRHKKIEWKDVVYLSAGKNYISAFNAADKCEYFIRGSLQGIIRDSIPRHMRHDFIQVNRADVVQFSFIEEVLADEVKTTYKTFPLSETLHKELRGRMNII
jgi:DNA-binding LytR/AlgR family response regulator